MLEGTSPLEIRITTNGLQAHVQWCIEVPGGTAIVSIQLWTVSIIREAVTRRELMAFSGVTGKAQGIRWNSLRWRSDRFVSKLSWFFGNHFYSISYTVDVLVEVIKTWPMAYSKTALRTTHALLHCVPKKWRQNSNHYNYGTPYQN